MFPRHSRTSAGRRFLRVLIILSVFGIIAGTLPLLFSKPRPHGVAGPDAERIAEQMLTSVNAKAWRETGAVRFTFHKHYHLWDRQRGFARVEFGEYNVLVRLKNRTGRVYNEAGDEVTGENAQK